MCNVDYFREAFIKYAEERLFYAENTADYEFIKENILLKIHHSMRVCGIAKRIADQEEFSKDEKNTAYLCAMFHDLGRFDQFLKYKTFLDAKSINHAELGADLIEKYDLVGRLDPGTRNIIINSTRLHNRQNVPEEIDSDLHKFVSITRDADKIDILELFCKYHSSRTENKNSALELDLPDTTDFNPEIAELIYEKKTVSNHLRKNYNDMKLIHLAWVLDLNYKESFRTVIRRRTIERLSGFLPRNEGVVQLVSFVRDYAESMAQ